MSADSVLLAEGPPPGLLEMLNCYSGLTGCSSTRLPAGPPVDLPMCFGEAFLPIKPLPQHSWLCSPLLYYHPALLLNEGTAAC